MKIIQRITRIPHSILNLSGLLLFWGLALAIMITSLSSCNLGFPIVEIDPPPDPDPIILDPCFPEQITSPAFVTGYMEITDPLTTDIKIFIGPHSAVADHTDQDDLWKKLDSLFELYLPQYHYLPAISPEDIRRFSVHVDGTNDKTKFHLKTYIQYNGYRHYFGWSTQGFMYPGSLSPDAYVKQALNYPSVRLFNYWNTEGEPGWDSITYATIDSIILGDTCKAGREWADFRMGIHSPEMVQRFVDQGWNTVLSATTPYTDDRAYSPPQTVDMRGCHTSKADILYLLELGYQVITDQDVL